MEKFKVGIIGLGFIGQVHAETLLRLPEARIAAVCDENAALAWHKASETADCVAYENFRQLLADPNIDAIHNCTPNHMHFEINKLAIENGKHILCEKPLGMSSDETSQILGMMQAKPELVGAVNFNYRMYPLMREYKGKFASGELGKVRLVHGRFLQDWLMYDTDYNWRLDSRFAGSTRALADIGSHWCDLAQALTGSNIRAVMADLVTVIPIRKKPVGEVKTFSTNVSGNFTPVSINTEDYASVMLRFENGASGVFYVSQVSAGHKCGLEIEVDTDTCSIGWSHQNCEQLWIGRRGAANQVVLRDPGGFEHTKQYTFLPSGHPEGFQDALKNNFMSFYQYVQNRDVGNIPDFATFEDGHRSMCLVDAMVRSHETKTWVDVD